MGHIQVETTCDKAHEIVWQSVRMKQNCFADISKSELHRVFVVFMRAVQSEQWYMCYAYWPTCPLPVQKIKQVNKAETVFPSFWLHYSVSLSLRVSLKLDTWNPDLDHSSVNSLSLSHFSTCLSHPLSMAQRIDIIWVTVMFYYVRFSFQSREGGGLLGTFLDSPYLL